MPRKPTPESAKGASRPVGSADGSPVGADRQQPNETIEVGGYLSDGPPRKTTPAKRSVSTNSSVDPARIAGRLLLENVIKPHKRLLSTVTTAPLTVVIEVPSPSYIDHIEHAFRDLCINAPSSEGDGSSLEDALEPRMPLFIVSEGQSTRQREHQRRDITTALLAGMSVIVISSEPETQIPQGIRETADVRVKVGPVTPEVLKAIIVEFTGEHPTTSVDLDCDDLDLDDLRLAIRRTGADDSTARLRRLLAASSRHSSANGGPRLEDLHGYGAAKEWGMALSVDLLEYRERRITWDDVDRGVIVAGPTGTGKTTFAQALARTCGVPLVLGTLAEWQAAGHLGDLLRTMRQTFQDARRRAPCVLFIDEVDAFGDRASLDRENRDYGIQVVNGFLEELDGARSREGVVVVGACNHPSRIDPAIRRAGRLDRIIEIGRPTSEDLHHIFRFHLRGDLSDADLGILALGAVGSTGADVEHWVRGARRRARQARRAMLIEDLMAEIRDGERPMTTEEKCRAAIHEAGHVVAAIDLGGSVTQVALVDSPMTLGIAEAWLNMPRLPTRAELQRRLVVLLAGRAAEEVILGAPSISAGGGAGSDLAEASAMAVNLMSSYGFGRGLAWWRTPRGEDPTALLAEHPDLRGQADSMLQDAYTEALAIVRRREQAVTRIGLGLVQHRYLDAAALACILGTGQDGRMVV